MNDKIYFDNAATTRVRPEVIELMTKIMAEDYGNPSSKHRFGMYAENYLRQAAEDIAATLKCRPGEILFTSGGTEADNMAIAGVFRARARRGRHMITSCIEHPAVYKTLESLEKEGLEYTVLGVDSHGHVSLEELEKAVRPDTTLVSIMSINNEMGAIEPVGEIGRLIKRVNPACYFHTDAIQAYCKMDLKPKRDGIDLMSVSSHKFHGPKGAGFLYIREGISIQPIIYGGGQQRGLRSGTDNVPGVAGMGLAARLYCRDQAAGIAHLAEIRDRLCERLKAMEGVQIYSDCGDLSAPQILSASFEGVRAEVLLHALEEKGIYVSSGSACSSNHPGISGTMRAIGVAPGLLDSVIRFSFGLFNEVEEADRCADALEELLPVLRRFRRY